MLKRYRARRDARLREVVRSVLAEHDAAMATRLVMHFDARDAGRLVAIGNTHNARR